MWKGSAIMSGSLTKANYYQVKHTEKYPTKFMGGTIWKMYSKHNPILPSFFSLDNPRNSNISRCSYKQSQP